MGIGKSKRGNPALNVLYGYDRNKSSSTRYSHGGTFAAGKHDKETQLGACSALGQR
jgi:hypothetical protein